MPCLPEEPCVPDTFVEACFLRHRWLTKERMS